MNKRSLLLFSLMLSFVMLAHDAHAALHAGAGQHSHNAAVAVHSLHAGDALASTSPIHQPHGLPELAPELCTVDGQANPPVATGPLPIDIAMTGAWHAAFPPIPHLKPSFEVPAYPPAVRRALLQVYLN
jgi:hypothetical protein